MSNDNAPKDQPAPPAVAGQLDQPVGPLIAKLREMQRPGAESDLTVMCAEAADALTELMEWRKLRDPVTLHVSLLRGLPVQLDRATLLHIAGADSLLAALEEAESVLRRVGCAPTADLCSAALRPNNKPQTLPRWPLRVTGYQPGGYVVWRDVFEGSMRCTPEEAAQAHKVATFVCESEALNYAEYRNAMTMKHGNDDVSVLRPN